MSIHPWCVSPDHYGDVMMGAIASQITSLTVVYSTVYSDADQRKHQSSASPAFVRGIHRGPVNSPHKWPVTRKMFPFDDIIMWVAFIFTRCIKTHLVHACSMWCFRRWDPWSWFSIKMRYHKRNSHCGDKTILWPSYLHNGISYIGKTASLYSILNRGHCLVVNISWLSLSALPHRWWSWWW